MRRLSLLVLAAACGNNDPVHHLPDGPPSQALPGIYVTNGDAILVFDPGAEGDVAPVRTITGPSTMLSLPIGIAVDQEGLVYAANRTGSAVTGYAKDQDGDVAPTRILTSTGMSSPETVVVDTDDSIFAATCPNCGGSAGGDIGVYHFPPGALTSDYTIAGSNTGFTNPAVALDSDRNLVISNSFGGDVATFPNTAMGNVAPTLSFTALSGQNIQSVIAAGGVIILGSPSSLELFPASTTGTNVTPAATLGAPMLPITYVSGMFLDVSVSPAVLYVVDYGASAIYVVTTSGSGAALGVASVRTIQGPTTKLASPLGIVAIH